MLSAYELEIECKNLREYHEYCKQKKKIQNRKYYLKTRKSRFDYKRQIDINILTNYNEIKIDNVQQPSIIATDLQSSTTNSLINDNTTFGYNETVKNERKRKFFDEENIEYSEITSCQIKTIEPEESDVFINKHISKKEFQLTFDALKQKHHISESAHSDYLKLINAILDKEKQIKNNKYQNVRSEIFSLCISCENVIHLDSTSCDCNTLIECERCNKKMENFITFNIQEQIQLLLSNEKCLNQIKKSNQKSRNKNSDLILDATDGLIYQNFIKNIDPSYLLVSLNLNTDGAPIDSIGNYKIWPILGTVVELEPLQRESFKNMIFLGVWISVEKPIMNIYLEKAISEIISNHKDKYKIIQDNIILRVQAVIVDLPAKAAVANIKQFNGKFGCSNCFHPGSWSHTYHKQIYKPTKNDDYKKEKTFEDYELYSKLAMANKTDLFGIKGESIISKVINLPYQMPFDYMHLFCAGHGKWILRQYLDKDADCSILESIERVEDILSNTKIPHIFNRKAKNILNSSKWKCSQIKLFFFYLSIPTLINILDNDYFILLAGYVCAMRILYEPIYNTVDIDIADTLLNEYYELLNDYFGEWAYDYTIHAHLHLPDQVRLHGPLHCHSQFCFEVNLFIILNNNIYI
jgi:hypothetical protein